MLHCSHYKTTCYYFVPDLVAVESSFVLKMIKMLGGKREGGFLKGGGFLKTEATITYSVLNSSHFAWHSYEKQELFKTE